MTLPLPLPSPPLPSASRPPELCFRTRIAVRFRDLDAMGHVNNAVYFTYLEVARMEYWFGLERLLTPSSPGPDAPATPTASAEGEPLQFINFVVLKAECTYRSPAVFGDTLIIRTGIRDLGVTSFCMDYTVHEEATGRLVAEARTTLVFYDLARKRASRIPDELRARILRFEESLRQAAAAG